MTYHIITRSQHPKGSGPFHGPDTYISVVAIPEGSLWTPNRPLNSACLAKHGVQCWHMGEGYAEHTGPRSALGLARAEAHVFIRRQIASSRGGASDPYRGWGEEEAA